MPARPRFANATLYWICVAVMAVALVDLGWLHLFRFADNMLSDWQLKGRAEKLVADPDIVIIDIDDYSLTRMDEKYVGRWPWPRSVYGELVTELEKQGAKAIVFDVEFYERDLVRPEQDDAFREAVVPTRNTFFAMQWLDKIGPDDGLVIAEVAAALELPTSGAVDPRVKLPLLLPNEKVVDKKALGRTGSINYNEDKDGVGRSYDLWRDVAGWRIPSLPARVGNSFGYSVPDERSMLLTWLAGEQHPHARVSFFDVYDDLNKEKRERTPLEFKDRMVLVGSTASGLHDFRNTPVSALMPGVEILATAIDNLKRGMILRPVPQYVAYALVVLSLLLLLYALERRWNLVQIFAMLSLGTVVLVGGAYAALSWSILLPVGRPLLFAWTFYFLAALLAYVRELRERTRTEAVLSRVLDPRVAKRLVSEGVKLEDIKSEQRTISVLFSDIRGFTTLSETRPAGEIVALLNRYFSMQAETVFKHGGALDKFIGDAIMAFWGAPTDDARHAEHAVACALDMAANLARFNAEIAESGIAIDIGVGIHTGTAVVGFVGSQRKLEYTAIGDTVNLASRIEGETKGRTRILVTEATRDSCDGAYGFRDFGEVQVKGRAAAVRVFAPDVAVPNAAPDASAQNARRRMNVHRFAPLTLAAALAATFAYAEPAITIKQVMLKEQAASDSKTVATLPANTTVDLKKREGAWVQLGSGSDVGWAKLFDIRLASAQTAPAKGGGGVGEVLGLASGQRSASVTTGVRGLDEDQLVKAQPNPLEFQKLVAFQVTREQAQQFAAAGKLTPREVELLK